MPHKIIASPRPILSDVIDAIEHFAKRPDKKIPDRVHLKLKENVLAVAHRIQDIILNYIAISTQIDPRQIQKDIIKAWFESQIIGQTLADLYNPSHNQSFTDFLSNAETDFDAQKDYPKTLIYVRFDTSTTETTDVSSTPATTSKQDLIYVQTEKREQNNKTIKNHHTYMSGYAPVNAAGEVHIQITPTTIDILLTPQSGRYYDILKDRDPDLSKDLTRQLSTYETDKQITITYAPYK